MKKALSYIVPVALSFLLGFIASHLQKDALREWYPDLIKPSLTPPNEVFPIAWSIIYLLSGISIGLIWNKANHQRRSTTVLWGLQLFFNFTWSIMFFFFRDPWMGFINIIILDVAVIGYAVKTWKLNKAASVLYWPYVLWLIFATYLNFFILIHN